MLPGHGAVQFQCRTEDLGDGLVRLLLHPRYLLVDHDVDVDVAIAGMAEIDDGDVITLLDFFDLPDNVGNFGARHHDILVVLVRAHVPQRRRYQATHLPEGLRLLRVLRHLAFHQPERLDQLLDPGRLLLDQLRVAVHLDEKHRPPGRRDPEIEPFLHTLQGGMVHEFQRRRDDLPPDDGRDRFGRAVDGIEYRHHGLLRLGKGEQFKDDLRDHPEGPLAAADQPGQVVPHHPLVGLAAGTDDLAGGKHHLQTHDKIPGHAVLHATGAAGVFRHVPPQGGELEGRRVGGVEEAELFHFYLELLCDHPRFDLGHQILRIDTENPVHPGRHQGDPAPPGQRAAGEAAPRTAGKDRNPLGIGQPEDPGDLVGIGRMDHRIRQELHLGGVV